jgi:hypothetical protein
MRDFGRVVVCGGKVLKNYGNQRETIKAKI